MASTSSRCSSLALGFQWRRLCRSRDGRLDTVPTIPYPPQILRSLCPSLLPRRRRIRIPMVLPPLLFHFSSFRLSLSRIRFRFFSRTFSSFSRVPNTSFPWSRGPSREQEPAGSQQRRGSSISLHSRRTTLRCMICRTFRNTRSDLRRPRRRRTGSSFPVWLLWLSGSRFYVRVEMDSSPSILLLTITCKTCNKDQTAKHHKTASVSPIFLVLSPNLHSINLNFLEKH